MAKIKIRKVIKPLDLDDYYKTGESEIIRVWVNPPKATRDEYNEIKERSRALLEQLGKVDPKDEKTLKDLGRQLQETSNRYLSIWSLLWSQDKDEDTHWTPDDVAQLQKDCNDNDPGLWQFITIVTIGMINDYINTNQKKERRR